MPIDYLATDCGCQQPSIFAGGCSCPMPCPECPDDMPRNGNAGYWGDTRFWAAEGYHIYDLPPLPAPARFPTGPIVRHTAVADMTGDSWRFKTECDLLAAGGHYDASLHQWVLPAPAGWSDAVGAELRSMGARYDDDGEVYLPPVYEPNTLRRRGYYSHPITKATRKMSPHDLAGYARQKGWSLEYMYPQERDEPIDQDARAFRDSGGRRNDGPVGEIQNDAKFAGGALADPNQMQLFE